MHSGEDQLRVSAVSELPFFWSERTDQILSELLRGKPQEPSVECFFLLIFYCPIVFAASNELSADLETIVLTCIESLFPLRPVCRLIIQEYHNRVEVPFKKAFIDRYNNDPNYAPSNSPARQKEFRDEFMLANKNFIDGCEMFTFNIWFDKHSNKMVGIAEFGDWGRTEGPPGHVHGGCLATLGDTMCAYSIRQRVALTSSLEIIYRLPVPLLSVVHFVGRQQEPKGNSIQTFVDFFDVTQALKFSAVGVFSRPKVKPKAML
jgi:hypothetical protein